MIRDFIITIGIAIIFIVVTAFKRFEGGYIDEIAINYAAFFIAFALSLILWSIFEKYFKESLNLLTITWLVIFGAIYLLIISANQILTLIL